MGGDEALRAMAAEQYQKKQMVKNDVLALGLGDNHFSEYLIYKRGGKYIFKSLLTICVFQYFQRVAKTSLDGRLKSCEQ